MSVYVENISVEFLSLLVILISALVYYIGFLWSCTQVQDYDKSSSYYASIFFVVKYLLVQVAFALFIGEFIREFIRDYYPYFSYSSFLESKNSFIFILVCLLIFIQLSIAFEVTKRTKKWELKKYERDYLGDMRSFSLLEILEYYISPEENLDLKEAMKFRKKTLLEHFLLWIYLLFNILVIYFLMLLSSTLKWYVSVFFVSLGLFFLILSNIVSAVGHSKASFPKVTIFLKDGTLNQNDAPFDGKVRKYGKYTYLLGNNEEYIINSDEIKYVKAHLPINYNVKVNKRRLYKITWIIIIVPFICLIIYYVAS